jgi:hypothetical protein
MTIRRKIATWLLVVGALALGLAPVLARANGQAPAVVTVGGNPFTALPKPCWPEALLIGRDTAYAAFPCASLEVLPLGMRRQVECTLDRLRTGGWDPLVYETYRSARRVAHLYSFGRTRPGPRVTNASNPLVAPHYWTLSVDIIDRKKLWNNPRFFYWLGQHYEACGLVAGAFWKSFPDAPHGQFAAIESMSRAPAWAKRLMAEGKRDSLLLRLGATR